MRKRYAGLAVLAASMFVTAAFANADQGPNEEAGDIPVIETIQMVPERDRRMTVPVTISGEGPFDFLVDTGAQATVVSDALATLLDLSDRENAVLVGMASERPVETAMITGFSLGERSITIRNAPILEERNIGADGILGLDSLQDQRVLLDFTRNEMHVSDSFEDGGVRSYDIIVRARERLGQLIIHSAEIDGVRTAVIIDTGATSSVGNPALLERLRRRHTLEDSLMIDVNGVQVTGETRVARRIVIDQAQLNYVPITFTDSPTFRHLGLSNRPAMILGMSELRLFDRVAIDFRSERVLFDVPGSIMLDRTWGTSTRATRLRR